MLHWCSALFQWTQVHTQNQAAPKSGGTERPPAVGKASSHVSGFPYPRRSCRAGYAAVGLGLLLRLWLESPARATARACVCLNGTKLVWLGCAPIPVSPPWLMWPRFGATESSFRQERLRTEQALPLFHCNIFCSWTPQDVSLPRPQGSVGFCHSCHPSQGGLSVISLCPLADFVDWLVERFKEDKGVQKHPLYPMCVRWWDYEQVFDLLWGSLCFRFMAQQKCLFPEWSCYML